MRFTIFAVLLLIFAGCDPIDDMEEPCNEEDPIYVIEDTVNLYNSAVDLLPNIDGSPLIIENDRNYTDTFQIIPIGNKSGYDTIIYAQENRQDGICIYSFYHSVLGEYRTMFYKSSKLGMTLKVHMYKKYDYNNVGDVMLLQISNTQITLPVHGSNLTFMDAQYYKEKIINGKVYEDVYQVEARPPGFNSKYVRYFYLNQKNGLISFELSNNEIWYFRF